MSGKLKSKYSEHPEANGASGSALVYNGLIPQEGFVKANQPVILVKGVTITQANDPGFDANGEYTIHYTTNQQEISNGIVPNGLQNAVYWATCKRDGQDTRTPQNAILAFPYNSSDKTLKVNFYRSRTSVVNAASLTLQGSVQTEGLERLTPAQLLANGSIYLMVTVIASNGVLFPYQKLQP